ncbi:uncharacterized protein si:rp71-46j2.7 [Scyliorhinus canicula]|uniref:uncharacterized protein si:rp71-46j2.7 n=1 Tax=Scyliorhinus canicula TaxID=7830 RepID=UPI0018F6A257|nr:uncharacterized protein si:rp71-46j2.7 [Scyliorhinus canicula]
MSPAQWVFGVLFAACLLYWDGGLLLLLPLWWCLGAGLGERSRDQQDLGPDPHYQQLPERKAEINHTNSVVDAADGKVQSSIELDPSLRQSLTKVFECSYSQFILLWYIPPEPKEDQPLYKTLLNEFNMMVDHAVGKFGQLDLTRIERGLIRILTVHLRAVKKEKKREKIFQTRHEEVCFLRRTSEALIYHLLPDSLWKLNCYWHILKEVVTLKVLEEVINTVCDADFINQALIKFLDEDSPETNEAEVIPEAPPTTGNDDGRGKTECNVPKEKEKKKSNKKKLPKFFKMFKRNKKQKNPETKPSSDHMDEIDGPADPDFRSLPPSESDLNIRAEDSAEEEDLNFSNEMPEWVKQKILISTENEKSSLRKCRISVSEVSWGETEGPFCRIDIESLEAAEDCWSIQRKYHEFEDLQKELSKTFSSLVETKLPSVNGTSSDKVSNEFKEDIKCQLNGFLEKLVSEESILSNENTLNFFSANDQIRDYWGLLTSLFTDEDEETDADSDTSEGLCDTDVGETEPSETNPENTETPNRDSAELKSPEVFDESADSDCAFRCMPDSGEAKKASVRSIGFIKRKRKRRRSQKKAERVKDITSQLHELLEELFHTDYLPAKLFLHVLKHVVSLFSSHLQKKLDQFFTREQIIVYVDFLREALWPNGKPAGLPPERSNEKKTFTKERAEELLQKKISEAFKYLPLCDKELVKVMFPMFQDMETNKRLVYRVLVFLLFEITPGIKESWIGDSLPCLERLNVNEFSDKPL